MKSIESKPNKLQNDTKSDNMEVDWKIVLKEAFIRLAIMNKDFTGSITFNCNQGGLVDYEYKERRT